MLRFDSSIAIGMNEKNQERVGGRFFPFTNMFISLVSVPLQHYHFVNAVA